MKARPESAKFAPVPSSRPAQYNPERAAELERQMKLMEDFQKAGFTAVARSREKRRMKP
jgi:hypothetical protein